jgi:cell wall-associated NlpC family hydrolase
MLPSCRALTAGVLCLTVIAPAEVPDVRRAAAAVHSPTTPALVPVVLVRAEVAGLLAERAVAVRTRVSRAPGGRAAAPLTRAKPRPRPRAVKAPRARRAAVVERSTAGSAARVVAFVMDQLGRPYRRGAAGPGAFDCSGLVLRAFGAVGRRLPHSAAAQSAMGRTIGRGQVRPGDLVYWGGRGSAYHVGVVVRVTAARVWIVDAPQPGAVVTMRQPWEGHRFARLIG